MTAEGPPPLSAVAAHTPLIQQYLDIKSRHADAILLFRVGDFYEMFFDDAVEGSRLLSVALTSRNNGASDVPLAGVPVRALDEYLPRLVRQGRRVAVCEQVEDAGASDGLVAREVVEVVTPGMVLDDTLLSGERNNFVAAIAASRAAGNTGQAAGLALLDLSTGEFELRACGPGELDDELARIEPAELLLPDGEEAPPGPWTVTHRDPWRFAPEFGEEAISRRFSVQGTAGFGLEPGRDGALLGAAGALIAYVEEVRPGGAGHLRRPRVERGAGVLHLDAMTRHNLELVSPLREGEGRTLVDVLDRTLTPMGGRMLRRWVLEPLARLDAIRARHDAVEALVADRERRHALREGLGRIRDLERLAARLSVGRIAPREMLSLARSLEPLPALAESLADASGAAASGASGRLAELARGLDPLQDVRGRIESAIDPEAPPAFGSGGVIRHGYSSELDERRDTREGAVEWIAQLQVRERQRTGIDSLKVGFNRVFGYYLEVTRPNLDRVPVEYQRKQTLSNAERYFTPELKEWEAKVVGAEDEIATLEARLFRELRELLAAEVRRVQETAARIAELDALAGLAETAARNGYVRPEMDDGAELDIRAGRHPVVEGAMRREDFIPNDVALSRDAFAMVLTGPNMAGKSTLLRQVGLTVLMAQMGSFVPADAARIGLCDRIFTRVGASDDLAAGQSTFMVEMTETAAILNGATERSLVLLDEIGRGTSTYDGVAIAWAVTEFIHDRLRARTIFATHYHELVELTDMLAGARPWNIAVRETGDGIVFLRRLEAGGCDRSYGVQVARLAGLPPDVIERAFEILHELEGGSDGTGSRLSGLVASAGQLSLWGRRRAADPAGASALPASPGLAALRERLDAIDPDRTTPLEALALLDELKRLAC